MKNRLNLFFILLLISVTGVSGQSKISNIVDVDGNSYKVVRIGEQYWMAENLRVSKLNDKTPIKLKKPADSALFVPAFYASTNKNIGYLYNIEVINTSKNVCPAGWHVPSHREWGKLEQFLGMSADDVEAYSGDNKNRGLGYGNKLKSALGWGTLNGTNDYGFNALKGESSWWTSTPDASAYVGDLNYVTRSLRPDNSNIELWKGYQNSYCHIRCVKDEATTKAK
jgi:uncharacterized protein (TIGR02145 family)